MGSKALGVYRALSKLPLPPLSKFRMIQMLRNGAFTLKSTKGAPKRKASLIMSNEGYGHEYWLKKYSGFKGDIAAQIEHGVYFGGNTSPEVNPLFTEHEIGAFITYGPYREKHLSSVYPDHAIYAIGPYIQYANTDQEYLDSLRDIIDSAKKTLTLFPSHSVRDGCVRFCHEELAESVKDIAENEGYGNIIVCLSPMDHASSLANFYESQGFVVVSCGEDSLRFLSKQRAIMEASDLTVSNDVGTHIGYSLAMGVPHFVINPISVEEKVKGNCVAPGADLGLFRKEHDEIVEAFSDSGCLASISSAQKRIYDYYWGGLVKLSPEEMRTMLEKLDRPKSAMP